MKIEIDTKHDSHEEIKKVISMLQHLVGNSQSGYSQETKPVNIFEDPNSFGTSSSEETPSETPPTANLFGMFGSTETPTQSSEEQETEEKPKDTPQIIPY